MNTHQRNIEVLKAEKHIIKGGLLLCLGYLMSFMAAERFNPDTYIELQWSNLFIQVIISIFILQRYYAQAGVHFSFAKGVIIGTLASALGTLLFSSFLYYHLTHTGSGVSDDIKPPMLQGYHNPLITSVIMALESLFCGFFLSFGCMHYYQLERNGTRNADGAQDPPDHVY